MLRSFPFASRGTIRVVINTMSVHREGVEPNSVDGLDHHHHDHITHEVIIFCNIFEIWDRQFGRQVDPLSHF